MRLAAVLVAAALAGCVSTPKPQAVRTQCLPLKAYTPEFQAELAAALAPLPEGSALARAMADFGAMRAADRACLAANPP
jgi:hypothetical protein